MNINKFLKNYNIDWQIFLFGISFVFVVISALYLTLTSTPPNIFYGEFLQTFSVPTTEVEYHNYSNFEHVVAYSLNFLFMLANFGC